MIKKLTKRTYPCQLIINQRKIISLEISTHYEKHEDINDELILELSQQLLQRTKITSGFKKLWR